jgi:hypothetical protein
MLGEIVLSRPVGVVALTGLVALFLGCMSLSIGERKILQSSCFADGDLLCQTGKVTVRPSSEKVVFYPIPYASPPNLELEGDSNVIVVEQKDDHFRVKSADHGPWTETVTWSARGVRRLPPSGPPAPPADPPPPDLPPRPVPIDPEPK